MIEDHHARRIHRLKKRSPTSYFWQTETDPGGALATPTPTPTDSNAAASQTQNQLPPATPPPSTQSQPAQPAQPATDSSSSSASAAPADSSSSSGSSSSSASAATSSSTPVVAPSSLASQSTPSHSPLGASVPSVAHTSSTPSFHVTAPTVSATGASQANDSTGTSSTHTGTIVGIAAAVVGGLVALFFIGTYFMRRSRRNSDDELNSDALRRQSMMLPDEPQMRSRGNSPRPPSMIEQHLNHGAVSYDPSFGDHSYYGGGQASFAPGQVVTMPPQAWSPHTPNSAQPFYNPMGDTPLGSPISPAPYESFYNAQGQLVRQPSNGAGVMLNRQPSSGPHAAFSRTPSPGPNAAFEGQMSPVLTRQPSGAMLNRQPSYGANAAMQQSPFGSDELDSQGYPVSPPPAAYVTRQGLVPDSPFYSPADAHYVDLNRSSVSPFQAAQYEEISQRLQTTPPQPLPTPEVAAFAEEALSKPAPVVPNVSEPRPLNVTTGKYPGQEHDQQASFMDVDVDDELPVPSPAYSGKSRINSTPPTLPEIHLPDRAFSPVTMEFPTAPSSVHPSPLSSQFSMPSPPPSAHFGNAKPDTPTVPVGMRATREDAPSKRPDTVYTLYDDDDAYAGI
ncbi:hypothetical protein BDW22DRAFT_1431576 [Trametopsis cervina]|nr:hypothetical protein BDW22DRAFT_1431576 [Trametopsis cervina]